MLLIQPIKPRSLRGFVHGSILIELYLPTLLSRPEAPMPDLSNLVNMPLSA